MSGPEIARGWALLLVLLAPACGSRSPLDVDPGRASDDAGARLDARADVIDAAIRRCEGAGRWSLHAAPTSEDLYDVRVVSVDDAWIVGARGTLLHWDGRVWGGVTLPLTDDLGKIWAAANAGWIVTPSQLLRREADRWTSYPLPEPAPAVISAVWGRAPDDVWFGGGSVSPAIGVHARWDGGTLDLVEGEPTGIQVSSMRGTSDGRAIWSVSQLGRVARSVDGARWERLPGPSGETATSVWPASPDEAFLSALRGEVHHWIAGAWETWRSGDAEVYYYAVWGSSEHDVWVVGGDGASAHFDGLEWIPAELPTRSALYAIDGTCATDAWAVGAGGTILRLEP